VGERGGDGSTVSARPYPRLREAELRALEGYVDLRRVVPRGCASFRAELPGVRPGERLELASAGPATLWIDERPAMSVAGSGARLGTGALVPLPEGASGVHRVRVDACPGEGGTNGFYLVRRMPVVAASP
jgi:hypothetical protein